MPHVKAADRFSTFSSTGFAQLALGVAASAIASGYGRGAYGGTCAPIATPGSYLCAGPADPVGDVPQLITPPANGADIIITSTADFGLDRSTARYNAGIVVQDMSGGRDIAVTASNITGDYFSGPAIEITQENGAGQRVELETSQGAITYGGGLAVQSAGDIAITTGDVISEFSDAISVTGKPTPDTAPYTAIGTLRIETTAGRLDGYSSGSVDDQAAGIWVYSDYAKDISITTGDVAASSNAIWVLTEKQGQDTVIDTRAGTIESSYFSGIRHTCGACSDITITTADIVSDEEAIWVSGQAFGVIEIDTRAGALEPAGSLSSGGIFVEGSDGAETRITTGDVTANGVPAIELVTSGTSARLKIAGQVEGKYGIVIRDDSPRPAYIPPSVIESSGLIKGRNGLAVAFDDGDDELALFDELAGLGRAAEQGLGGSVLFMGGDDLLSFNQTGTGPSIFYDASYGGVFDGGIGEDLAMFSVPIEDLFWARGIGGRDDFLVLEFAASPQDSQILYFKDFELFSFSDAPERFYTPEELRSLAAIPLPASLALMLGGIGGGFGALAFARRGKARSQ